MRNPIFLILVLFLIYFIAIVVLKDVYNISGRSNNKIAVIFLATIIIFLEPLYRRYLFSTKSRKIKLILSEMGNRDPRWDEGKIIDSAKLTFLNLYKAWNVKDFSGMKKFLSPEIYKGWERELNIQPPQGEGHKTIEPHLTSVLIIDIQTPPESNIEYVTLFIKGSRNEVIMKNGAEVTNKKTFSEFWTFGWEDHCWKLFKVMNDSAWRKLVDFPLS